MAFEDLLTLGGQIDEILPDGRFGVMPERPWIIACAAGRMRNYRIRSIVGDRVLVEMTPYNLGKGRNTGAASALPLNQTRKRVQDIHAYDFL